MAAEKEALHLKHSILFNRATIVIKEIFMSIPACAESYNTPVLHRKDSTTFINGFMEFMPMNHMIIAGVSL